MPEGGMDRPLPIGVREPRARARRLVAGRGCYTDDISLPRMLHVAFLRSPYAHARIRSIDVAAAAAAPGVEAVFTGRDIAAACNPWQGNHALFPDLDSPPQYPLAIEIARWQGEAVAAVVAETRAQAEDALALIEIDWEELPAVVDPEAALVPGAPKIHPDRPSNLALEFTTAKGDVDDAFARAAHVIEETFVFGRHTGVTLEPRTIIAEFDPTEERLVVHQSHQAPHQQQDLYARLLGIPEHKVRVICPDVGGAFGVKLQFYADEAAVAVIARLLGRPVKFVADRFEAFAADIHARDHRITARLGVDAEGRIVALDVDDLFAIGPYSQYPRASVTEGGHIARLTGAPYRLPAYRARVRMVYQNKGLIGHYRAVGQPIACAVAERLIDGAAAKIGLDPVEIRRRNYLRDEDFPYTSPTGVAFEHLSLNRCLDLLVEKLDLPALRAEQQALRAKGIYRGIGIASFVELTGPGPDYYGQGQVRVSSQDGCIVKLEPSGKVRVVASATDQGQGTDTAIAQVVAAGLGVRTADVHVLLGDSEVCPYGGGAYASRGASIGCEIAFRAARQLKGNVLKVAGALLQMPPDALDIRDGAIVDAEKGVERLTLADIGRVGYFQQYLLPPDLQPELAVVQHYVPRDQAYIAGNGIQASYVELDPETGFVKLLRHAVVHDCGLIINPLLLDEQIRGGVVQGIGGALFEEVVYGSDGQMLSATMADYIVPMSSEMPDIDVWHVEAGIGREKLGAKGVGEAGTAGAMGAVLNAVNDALLPFGARIAQTPCTPQRILRAIREARARGTTQSH